MGLVWGNRQQRACEAHDWLPFTLLRRESMLRYVQILHCVQDDNCPSPVIPSVARDLHDASVTYITG